MDEEPHFSADLKDQDATSDTSDVVERALERRGTNVPHQKNKIHACSFFLYFTNFWRKKAAGESGEFMADRNYGSRSVQTLVVNGVSVIVTAWFNTVNTLFVQITPAFPGCKFTIHSPNTNILHPTKIFPVP